MIMISTAAIARKPNTMGSVERSPVQGICAWEKAVNIGSCIVTSLSGLRYSKLYSKDYSIQKRKTIDCLTVDKGGR